jgi:RNA polymerase sigma factor (TIGR02999 family)
VDSEELSKTLKGVAEGDVNALDRLLPVVYQEMRQLAARYLRGERTGHTLQPTALAHEAYLRLVGERRSPWQGRHHFMAVAAHAMRAILVDHARRRKAQKRGGGLTPLSLDATMLVAGSLTVAFDDLDRALDDLARFSERQARVVELRYFGGLTIEETAEILGVSAVTVKRDWAFSRAWLYRELTGAEPRVESRD